MEEYSQMNGGGRHRGNLLYSSNQTTMSFHLQSTADHQECFQSPTHVKTEASNNNNSTNHHLSHHQKLRCSLQGISDESLSSDDVEAIKAKIVAHPRYSNLLEAYMDCQKVGAPPEVVVKLAAARQEVEARQRSFPVASSDAAKDPELDQFMEAYYDTLVKYREELARPLQEAMEFMRGIEAQLNMLSNGPVRIFNAGEDQPQEHTRRDRGRSKLDHECSLVNHTLVTSL